MLEGLKRLLSWLIGKPSGGKVVAYSIMPAPVFIGFDNAGVIVPGGLLFIYNAGTTVKATIWTDSTGTVPHANPVVLSSAGRAIVFIAPGAYKYILAPAGDTDPPTSPIWTSDGVPATVPASSVATTIDVFTASGTWTKATGASIVFVTAIGGGAGGGSGRRGAAGTIRGGGGGGSSGAYSSNQYPASTLGATETVTVGAGGTGAVGIAVNDNSGGAGSPGGSSVFGTGLLTAIGGNGGTGGTGAAGGQGGAAPSGGNVNGVAGGNGSNGTVAAVAGVSSAGLVGGGGGGAGGIDAANAANNGAAGGSAGVRAGGNGAVSGVSDATAGSNAVVGQPSGGGGGGGGAGAANRGGFGGGNYGAGGAGGGGVLNGTTSGAGGRGGDGVVVVIQVTLACLTLIGPQLFSMLW